MHGGTIVDATIIVAPSSIKNKDHKRGPEMHHTDLFDWKRRKTMIYSYKFDEDDLKSMRGTFKNNESYKNPERNRYRDFFISKLKNNEDSLNRSTLKWQGHYYICDFTNNDPAIEKKQILKFIEVEKRNPDGIIFKRNNDPNSDMFGLIAWNDFKNAFKVEDTLYDGKQSYRLRNGNTDVNEIDELDKKEKIKDFDEVVNGSK